MMPPCFGGAFRRFLDPGGVGRLIWAMFLKLTMLVLTSNLL